MNASRQNPSITTRALTGRAGFRLATSIGVGLVAALIVMLTAARSWAFDLMAGWTVGATIFAGWTWLTVRGMDAKAAATHAREEDPSVAGSDVIVILSTLASLAGVGLLLLAGGHKKTSGTPEAILGMGSVVASWFLVHLTYMLRYARQYYGPEPACNSIDFEGGDPDYYDFAYVAFDLGMTYQISDTNLKNRWVRRLVLQHTLLSYALGVGVVATAINLVVSLASNN